MIRIISHSHSEYIESHRCHQATICSLWGVRHQGLGPASTSKVCGQDRATRRATKRGFTTVLYTESQSRCLVLRLGRFDLGNQAEVK